MATNIFCLYGIEERKVPRLYLYMDIIGQMPYLNNIWKKIFLYYHHIYLIKKIFKYSKTCYDGIKGDCFMQVSTLEGALSVIIMLYFLS